MIQKRTTTCVSVQPYHLEVMMQRRAEEDAVLSGVLEP